MQKVKNKNYYFLIVRFNNFLNKFQGKIFNNLGVCYLKMNI